MEIELFIFLIKDKMIFSPSHGSARKNHGVQKEVANANLLLDKEGGNRVNEN